MGGAGVITSPGTKMSVEYRKRKVDEFSLVRKVSDGSLRRINSYLLQGHISVQIRRQMLPKLSVRPSVCIVGSLGPCVVGGRVPPVH